jgi:hypothetical protein
MLLSIFKGNPKEIHGFCFGGGGSTGTYTKLFMPLSIFKEDLLISKGNPLILLSRRRDNGVMDKIVDASIDFQRKSKGNPLILLWRRREDGDMNKIVGASIVFQKKSIDYAWVEEGEQ